MTPKESMKALAQIELRYGGDIEILHTHTDKLVVECLRAAGYEAFAERYAKMCKEEFWYA